MAPRLYVNVDHVATLRQQRGTRYPDPVIAAALCELAGAQGITVHLREDRRHVQERDVRVLRQTVQGVFNLEMAATDEMLAIALDVRPDLCTLVPEQRAERTTEGGLDVRAGGILERVVGGLRGAGIGVSLFIDPEAEAVAASHRMGAGTVELHTGYFCDARAASAPAASPAASPDWSRQLSRLRNAAGAAGELGLRLGAGHGLDSENVALVAALPHLAELNIGHGLVARALMVGFERAVTEMLAAIRAGAAQGGRGG